MSERIDKVDWYIKIAKDVALRSPCIDRRRFGSILVKNDTILSTGYNGSPRGTLNCGIDIPCLQNIKDVGHCKDYSSCNAIHSEQNVIINSARNGISTLGAILYLAEANGKGDRPCFQCRRFMINAGIYACYYEDRDGSIKYEVINPDWVKMENEWIMSEYNKYSKADLKKVADGIYEVQTSDVRPSIDIEVYGKDNPIGGRKWTSYYGQG